MARRRETNEREGSVEAAAGPGPLQAGLVTSGGSLPHADPLAAALFALEEQPDLPAAPQLPALTPLEGMVAQWAWGIPGVTVAGDGSLAVDPAALDPDAPVDPGLDRPGHEGLRTFLDLVSGRTQAVKLQLTGPVTLALALAEAGAPAERALAVTAAAIRTKAAALLELARDRLPEAPLLVVVDEPAFTFLGSADCPVDPDSAVDALSSALAVMEGDAVTGVHCCGPVELRYLTQAGPRLLSVPAAPHVLAGAGTIASFLEAGGWVAWGAVPTHAPVGPSADPLWRRLTELWCDLVRAGCDPVALRTRALVTPECGLANHGLSQARLALRLAREVAGRVADQAAAAKLSVGA